MVMRSNLGDNVEEQTDRRDECCTENRSMICGGIGEDLYTLAVYMYIGNKTFPHGVLPRTTAATPETTLTTFTTEAGTWEWACSPRPLSA